MVLEKQDILYTEAKYKVTAPDFNFNCLKHWDSSILKRTKTKAANRPDANKKPKKEVKNVQIL